MVAVKGVLKVYDFWAAKGLPKPNMVVSNLIWILIKGIESKTINRLGTHIFPSNSGFEILRKFPGTKVKSGHPH